MSNPLSRSMTLVAALCLGTAAAALAQPATGEEPGATDGRRGVPAVRLAPGQAAPAIDGRLDDPVWGRARPMTDFVQREPENGAPSAFSTEARVAVDDRVLYVAVEAFDEDPSGIVGRLTRRDEMSSSDWILLVVDADLDRITGYEFFVNPAGVMVDGIAANGQNDDLRWDAVWEVETRVTDRGWTAEFAIPLSQMAFSADGPDAWGIQVGRIVQRAGETSFWTHIPASDPNFMSYVGTVSGFGGLAPPRRLEVTPYALARVDRAPVEADDPFADGDDWDATGGVDVKYGLTSSLVLDATINPDFGQVEADPSEVNLSAFESFFSERRPFFVEGADIYRYGLGVGDGDVETLFYSRRIGRAPQVDADDRGGRVRAPDQTSILGAAKVSGRTAGGWSIGVLEAVTAEEEAEVISGAGARFDEVVEPLTNYAVARVRKDWREGKTQLGAIGTSVQRRLDGTGLEDLLRSSAWTGGVDLTHRLGDVRVSGKVMGTHVRGSEAAILATQRSSARWFQRPDADHVEVDSTRTSLSGWAGALEVFKESGGSWRWATFLSARSPGFEPNDVGFMRETDQIGAGGFAGYRLTKPAGPFRRGSVNVNFSTFDDFGGLNVYRGGNVNGSAQLRSFWWVGGGIARDFDNWKTDALRGGPAIREPGTTEAWAWFETDDRRALTFSMEGEVEYEDDTDAREYELSVGAGWQVTGSTRISIAPFYEDARGAWQYVDQMDDAAGARRYVFAGIDQKTFGVTVRANHTFTPTFSVQLYAQPFTSAGSYAGFLDVADVGAEPFGDRFRALEGVSRDDGTVTVDEDGDGSADLEFADPDFNVREMNANLVARWEYRPGSTMFFVWSQSRDSFGADPEFRLADDLGDLFAAESRNVFLVKVSGWLNL